MRAASATGPSSPDASSRAPERLRRSGDIRSVFGAKRKLRGKHVDVHLRDRGESHGTPRAAVVAGRRVGSAVYRNRAKRRLRAALRETRMPAGRDAVVVARPGADAVPFEALRREVARVGTEDGRAR